MARTDRQRRSTNIEDRRGQGPAMGGGQVAGSGAAILVRLLFSRMGRRLILPLIVLLVIGLVFFRAQTLTLIAVVLGGQPPAAVTRLDPDTEARFEAQSAAVLGSTEDVWGGVFRAEGQSYPEPTLVLFTGAVNSACGFASAAVGPFYCPGDRKLYLDLGFFKDMETQLGAEGDFAQAYVIAHEVGHHVQNLLGILPQVNEEQQRDPGAANELSVRLELQADCFAGVWAHTAYQRQILEDGDLEEGLTAAAAIGDDRIQSQAGRRVDRESFTHGSSEQRTRWFLTGFQGGDVASCDTFSADPL
jgi:predicted metalloprotease